MTPRDLILAVLAALIWGATFPVTAVALDETPPLFFACLRFIGAAVFIAIIPRPQVPWPALLSAGLLLGAGQYGFLFVSMTQGISPGLASLLVHTQAFFTIIIAMVVFGEPLRWRQAAAIGLAFCGLGLLAADRFVAGGLVGLVLILCAALSGAAGNNVLKALGGADMLGVAVWMSLAPPLPLLALSFIFESGTGPIDLVSGLTWRTAAAVAYSAVLATVVAFTIWGRLFAAYSAALVAPFFLLVPVFGMGLSALLLGEDLSALQLGGAGLIFVGLCAAVLPSRPLRR